MGKPRFVSLKVLELALLSALPSAAQTVLSSVFGTVTDATGAVIPAADVTLTNLETNEKRMARSDANGNYVFDNLPRGNYSVAVGKPGFRRLVTRPVIVRVQSSIRIDALLEAGEASHTIEVIAEAAKFPIYSQGATDGTEEFERLPAGTAEPVRSIRPW